MRDCCFKVYAIENVLCELNYLSRYYWFCVPIVWMPPLPILVTTQEVCVCNSNFYTLRTLSKMKWKHFGCSWAQTHKPLGLLILHSTTDVVSQGTALPKSDSRLEFWKHRVLPHLKEKKDIYHPFYSVLCKRGLVFTKIMSLSFSFWTHPIHLEG